MDGPSGGRASPDRAACCPRALRAGRVGKRTSCYAVRRWRDDVMTGHCPVALWRCYLQAPGGENSGIQLIT